MECKNCGKEFTPKNRRCRYCSPECKIEGYRKLNEKSRTKNKEKIKLRAKMAYRKTLPVKKCPICKNELADYRQKYCLDCILKNYTAVPKGQKLYWRHLLTCRGWDKETITEELKERGYI